MNTSVVIALPNLADAKRMRLALERRGFSATAAVCTGAGALLAMSGGSGGILVCGYRLADMYYREVLEAMPPGFSMILLASQKVVAEAPPGLTCLVTPVGMADLAAALSERLKAPGRGKQVRPSQEQEKIEKAKRLLMEKKKFTEEEAHRYLQKRSMDAGSPMVQTAEMVLLLFDS